ncbi:hypothetical protein [Streptosporangium sandarakinum]|uniref:hypothetical protein n=1 Tax=Streptosporangium sandarakinum TaxID=1260955 RepID=UPI0034473F5D
MSPRRGDRAAPPPRESEWTLRFENSQAADGWEMPCKQAPGNTRRAWDDIKGSSAVMAAGAPKGALRPWSGRSAGDAPGGSGAAKRT